MTVADEYGRRWSARAAVRAEHYVRMSQPAWEAVAVAAGVGPGTALLDVGCGSGEFLALAAERGATVAGIDAAPVMVELAAAAVPGADVRNGTLEQLPWPPATFDVVTGFNAFQFAIDIDAALVGVARATRPGGCVAVCNWGGDGPQDLVAITHRLLDLAAEPTLVPRRPIEHPGFLEGCLAGAGLEPVAAGDVPVPWAPPDFHTLQRGLLAGGNLVPVVEKVGASPVRDALAASAEPFRRPDGSYLFESTFRWVVARQRG